MVETSILPLVLVAIGTVAFGLLITITVMGAVIMSRTSKLPAIAEILQSVEIYLADLSEEVNAGLNAPGMYGESLISGDGTPMFRSLDGKHSASSLEELLQKMSQDPDSGITEEHMEQIKDFFQNNISDEDDNEEDEEDWKKNK